MAVTFLRRSGKFVVQGGKFVTIPAGKTAADCLCCGSHTITVPCCPNPIPATLRGFITGKTGFATALPDEIALVWQGDLPGGSDNWYWPYLCGTTNTDLVIQCLGTTAGDFRLFSGGSGIAGAMIVPVSAQCDPFQLVFTISGTYGCGTGGYVLTITP